MHIASSPWAEYIREREGAEVLETSEGFAVYTIRGRECYLSDIYVFPEYRRTKIATHIADQVSQIAIKSNCTHLVGSVSPKAAGCTASILTLIGYGMLLHSSTPDLVYFYKKLEKT